MVQEFLSRELHLGYRLRDVTHDPEALGEFLATGARLPPVVVMGGRVIEGFQPEELSEAAATMLPSPPAGESHG